MTISRLKRRHDPRARARHVCGAALLLALALGLNAAAQEVKLGLKFPDFWIPVGQYCSFVGLPTYNSTDGILYFAVGNGGSGPAPKSQVRIREMRGELETMNGPWTFYKDWWAPAPAMAPGQQAAIQLKVGKWNKFDSKGKPIKFPRRWFIKADGDNKVLELNETNNGLMHFTLN
jgi:hypothetical protein